MSSDPAPAGRPFRPWAPIIPTGEYALDVAGLAGEELPGTPTYADIHVVVRWTGGEVTSHSIRALERAAFTAATGIAPSYASDGPAPGPMPSEVAGPFRTDIGAVLARPEAPVTLAVVARLGSWRSEEVRLVLRP